MGRVRFRDIHEGDNADIKVLKGVSSALFPHFVAAKEGPVIVQLSGIEKFKTNYLEK